jgi:carbon-monoxide dehydrogenase catalytic subunit
MTFNYIDKAREALKLRKYEPGKFGAERVLMDMASRRDLERSAAVPHAGVGGINETEV